MRLLIIVTAPDYALWPMTQEQNWQVEDVLPDTTVRVTSVDNDRIVVLCQAELGGEIYDKTGSTQQTTKWVTEIVNCDKYGAEARVHIAAHAEYVDFKSIRSSVDNVRLIACASFSHLPESPGRDEVSDALYRLLPKPCLSAFDAAVRAVKNQQTLTHAQRLSTLKHRLAHLFLPVSVDLQAWSGYGFDDEYMKEILASYGDEDERLKRARGLLYGEGQPEEADNVEKVVVEANLEKNEMWNVVKTLLPRDEPDSDKEKDAATAYCEVFQELNVLGSLKDKEQLKRLRNFLQSGENPFNQWYTELDAALVKLRNKMHGAN